MFDFETGWTANPTIVGKISEDFTFENVRKAAQEVAKRLKPNDSLVIGYDSRFLAEKFADEAVKVMEAAGIGCYLVEHDTPTPVVAWEVGDKGAAGAVMVTAGSMSADFCGMKFIKGQGSGGGGQGIERFEPRERYIKYITQVADWSRIRQSKPKIVVDPMYGSGRGYLDKVLQELGCQVEEIHDHRDVLFGGKNPDPVEENLGELKAKMTEVKADVGIALNGDVTSFAVIGKDGKYQRPAAGADVIVNILEIIARGVL